MKNAKILAIAGCAVFFNLAIPSARAADTNDTANPVNADNTEVNARDRNETEPTADQAKNDLSDREIMQKIRKAVVADKSLSTYGHNIKIISENGKVTLKGPVRSEAEREKIMNKAVRIAGKDNVTDELSIKARSRRG